ncbi:MAG: BACON domain-containing carbohydrate-binding protein [Flavobacteriales bacterium]
MTIGGQTFNITQNGACTYSLSPANNLTVLQGGGSYTVGVTTQSGCAWTASESLSWVTITGGSSGTGNGTVSYTVTSNTGAARNGTITIAGSSFQVSQAGVCTIALNPTDNLSVPVNGGNYSIAVSTQAGCAWTASESLSWVSITSGASGTGNGTVNYSVTSNGGTSRSGTLTIAGLSFQVSQAGVAPTTYSISASMPSVNGGSTLIPLPAPYKICADGSTATSFTVTATGGVPNMGNIKLRVQGTPSDVEQFGGFDNTYTGGTNTRTNEYQHPNYLPNAFTPARQLVIEAYDEPSNQTVASMTVRIVRAPMLFVHGLWGAASSLNDMRMWLRDELGAANAVLRCASYPGDRYFVENVSVIPDEIDLLLQTARGRGFSAGTVDVVAHSMGGVLSRIYLAGPAYRQDIHTVTTINTPHSGTQGANLLLSPYGERAREELVERNDWHSDRGAVSDLCFDSAPIEALNSDNNVSIVPILTYSSTSNPFLVSPVTGAADWKLVWMMWFFNRRPGYSPQMHTLNIGSAQELASNLFQTASHDAIVPVASQKGGNVGIEYPGVAHTESPENVNLWEDLKYRLGTVPTSTTFDQDGFNPPSLSIPWWVNVAPQPVGSQLLAASRDQGTIQTTSSVWGMSVPAGSLIDYHISWSGESTHRLYGFFEFDGEYIHGIDTVGQEIDLQYSIPPDMVGEVRVFVFTDAPDGTMISSTAAFAVSSSTPIDSLGYFNDLDTFYVQVGREIDFFLTGYYGNDSERIVTDYSQILYTLADSSVLIRTGVRKFRGEAEGVTSMTVTYGGESVNVPVKVTAGVELLASSYSSSTRLICGAGSVQYEGHFSAAPLAVSWSFPGGTPSASTDLSPVVSYEAAGNYEVGLITTWASHIDTILIHDYVTVNILPTVSISASGSTTFFEGESIEINAIGSNEVSHYFWSSLDTNQTISVSTSGEYSVIAIDDEGCTAEDVVQIVVNPLLKVAARALLDGPYDAGQQMMHDSLRIQGLIPLTEPYTALGYQHLVGGGESIAPSVLSVAGNNAIVDWVVLELRSGADPAQVLQTRCGLMQRNGDVVDKDGVSPVGFSLPEGSYYVTIRHRNHFGAMTSDAVVLSSTASVVDFTSVSTTTYGTEARKTNGIQMTLWSGNTLWDTELKYTGSSNDRDPVLVRIGGIVPTNTVPGYFSDDVNLDGVVKYTGSGNDRDAILVNIGGTVPTQVRSEQLP